jgi:hypothetical protein
VLSCFVMVRRSFALLSMVVVLLAGAAGSRLLCVGEEGHAHLEMEFEECCAAPSAPHRGAGVAPGPSCVDCTDYVLKAPGTRPSAPTLAALPEAGGILYPTGGSSSRTNPAPLRPTPSSLHSSILRC